MMTITVGQLRKLLEPFKETDPVLAVAPQIDDRAILGVVSRKEGVLSSERTICMIRIEI